MLDFAGTDCPELLLNVSLGLEKSIGRKSVRSIARNAPTVFFVQLRLAFLCNKHTPCSSLGKQLGKYLAQNTDIDIFFRWKQIKCNDELQ